MRRFFFIILPPFVCGNFALVGKIAPYIFIFIASFFVVLWLGAVSERATAEIKVRARKDAMYYLFSMMATVTVMSVLFKFL